MDCVYSTWFTDAPNGFDEGGVSALKTARALPQIGRQIGGARAH
jgi:hypothetical protein